MNGLERLEQTLVNIKRIFQSSDLLTDHERKINGILKNIEDPINVMILGEFNAGKSTLINTLLKDDYLSTDDVPTTATITKLTYGESPEIRLYFEDSREEVISVDRLQQITAEVDEVGKKVRETLSYVHVRYPSDILKRITLIDTPGRNSTNENHTKATENFMDQADIAFWIFELSQSGTSTELAQLKKLNNYVHPIGIINRIDEIDEEEDSLESVIERAQTALNPFVTEFIGISALNAYDAVTTDDEDLREESNWQSFIQTLDREVTGDAVQSRKVDRIYQDLEKTLIPVKKIVDRAKESFHETAKQLQNADTFKDSLRKEIDQLNQLSNIWLKLSYNGNYFELQNAQWPLSSTHDEALKEEWQEQLFYMEELVNKDEGLKIEKDNLDLEVRQINEWKRRLEKEWEEYENSGLFGGEPIIFTGKKRKLEDEQVQLNADIDAYNKREYDYNYRFRGHQTIKSNGIERLRTITKSVHKCLEAMKEQKVALHNDKEYLEKARDTLLNTKWLPSFLGSVKMEIIPHFVETYEVIGPKYENEQIHNRYSACLSILQGFIDESISVDIYTELLSTVEDEFKEEELAVPKTEKVTRYKGEKPKSFSWFKVLSTVASVVLVFYLLYEFQGNLFDSEEKVVADADLSVQTELVTVVTDAANVRQEPNLNAPIVITVLKGEEMTVFDRTTDVDGRKWLKIELSTGEVGWISNKIIETVTPTVNSSMIDSEAENQVYIDWDGTYLS
jgi:small GTP-binding protein